MKLLLKLCMLPAFLMSAASAASDAEETIIKPGSSKEGKRTLYRNPKANRKLDIDTSLPPPESRREVKTPRNRTKSTTLVRTRQLRPMKILR